MRISSLQCRVMKIAVSFVVGGIVIDLASSPQAQEGQIRSCGRPRRAKRKSSCVACWARWTGSVYSSIGLLASCARDARIDRYGRRTVIARGCSRRRGKGWRSALPGPYRSMRASRAHEARKPIEEYVEPVHLAQQATHELLPSARRGLPRLRICPSCACGDDA